MEIACPHCQTRMKWSDEYYGKKLRCPKCKQIFIIQKPPEEKVTPISTQPKFSPSLDAEKETGKAQKDIASKPPGFDDQSDICANCGRAIAEYERAYQIDGRLFCVACEEKVPEQATSKSQEKVEGADEIQIKCRICENIYSPNFESNNAWICPNCRGKNPNSKRQYGTENIKSEDAQDNQSQNPDDSKKRFEEAKMICSGSVEPCFFCGDTPSDECAGPVTFCKLVDVIGSDRALKVAGKLFGGVGGLVAGTLTKGRTAVYKKRYVMVPRCLKCKQFHEKIFSRQGDFKLFALLGGTICGIIFAVISAFGNSPLWLVILAMAALGFAGGTVGYMIGCILALIYSYLAPPPDNMKPASHASNYHIVKVMLDKGWESLERPSTQAEDYMELPVDKEETYEASKKES